MSAHGPPVSRTGPGIPRRSTRVARLGYPACSETTACRVNANRDPPGRGSISIGAAHRQQARGGGGCPAKRSVMSGFPSPQRPYRSLLGQPWQVAGWWHWDDAVMWDRSSRSRSAWTARALDDLRDRLQAGRWPGARDGGRLVAGASHWTTCRICALLGPQPLRLAGRGGAPYRRSAVHHQDRWPGCALPAPPLPVPDATPLIMTRVGWPGSFPNSSRTLGPLTDSPAHGGDAADALDVVWCRRFLATGSAASQPALAGASTASPAPGPS